MSGERARRPSPEHAVRGPFASSAPRRAVFLDKDGTIVEDVPYNVDTSRLHFIPRAIEGLALLASRGFELVVVSNQSGIGRGYFDLGAFARTQERLEEMLATAGIRLSGFYFCPHAPEQVPPCDCRKPAPGLLHRAAQALNIDLSASWMVGDRTSDIEAGRRAGCRTVLVGPGRLNAEERSVPLRTPHYRRTDLLAAALLITGSKADADSGATVDGA